MTTDNINAPELHKALGAEVYALEEAVAFADEQTSFSSSRIARLATPFRRT